MAQHDYVIANQSGAAFRADLNNALAAIVSNNSGTGAPSVTYPYMPWADTANGLFKIRNAANNGWITLYQLDGQWDAIALEDGSAGSPSLEFKDSPGTGAYSPGADQFAITTDSTQRARWSSTALVLNVGQENYDFRVASVNDASLFSIDASADEVQVKNLNGAQLSGFRNLLINGNPMINQRSYSSGTATTTANEYTLDRWRVRTSGQSITWTTSNNVRTVTAPAGGVEQVIEGNNITSGTYTLNWTGTATALVNGSSVAKGGTVTLTGGSDATVRFTGGTFALAQLERGSIATPFEHRAYGQELALCQRYYARVSAEYRFDGRIGNSGEEATVGGMWFFPVNMRTSPTLTTLSETTSGNVGSISWTAKGESGALGEWSLKNLDNIVTRVKSANLAASAEL